MTTTRHKKKPHSRQRAAIKLSGQTTPPPVAQESDGFGIGRFNAVLLTVAGTHNGQPVYAPNVADTPVFYYEQNRWVAAYVSAPGAMDMPDPHPHPMYYLPGTSPVGQWLLGDGDAPAGTIA